MTPLKPLLAATALVALTACEAPTPGMTVTPDGIARVEEMGAAAIAPDVTPQVAIQAFADFCGRFPANPDGTRAAVEAEGYVLFVSGSELSLNMYAAPDGRPMVATGLQDGAQICMVMMREGASLDRALESFVRQRHGNAATSLGSMALPQGQAENIWAATSPSRIIYFTMVQTQPGIGTVDVIAQVTQ